MSVFNHTKIIVSKVNHNEINIFFSVISKSLGKGAIRILLFLKWN